jgi:small subunit ribosomal protein S20
MANHASAIKRNRQRIKRTDRNRSQRSALRTQVKKARATIASAPQEAAALVTTSSSVLDRAGQKGIIPPKRAARLKSRLARALHKAKSAAG